MNLQRYQLTTINMPSSTTATIPVFLSSLPLHFISSATAITTCSSSHSNDPTSHWEPNSSLQPTTRDNNKDNTVTLFHTHSHFLNTVPFFIYKCFTSIITLLQVKQINRRSNQTALQLEAPNIHTISIITHDSHHSTHSRSKYLPFPIPTFSASLCTFSLSTTHIIPHTNISALQLSSPPSPVQIRPFSFYFAIAAAAAAAAPCQLGHLHSPPCHNIHSG